MSTKHFRSFRGKQKFFKQKKTTEKKHNMPPYCSCGVIQVSVTPNIRKSTPNGIIYPMFSALMSATRSSNASTWPWARGCVQCVRSNVNAAPEKDIRGYLGLKQ